MGSRKFDLEERLMRFAVAIIDIVEQLPNSGPQGHLSSQIVRSGTAPALMYGEAQGAESRKDFIHKMRLALKELRETFVALRILERKQYIQDERLLTYALQENNELIAIFVKSINTAKDNLQRLT